MGFRGSIHPRHFEVEALEHAHSAFRSDRFASVVIDDFLDPALAAGLLAWFDCDGDFTQHHSLKDPPKAEIQPHTAGLTIERTVSEEAFTSAADDRRLARELLLRDGPPRDADSLGWLAHTQFLGMLASPEFKAYLAAITDTTDLRDVTYMARTMRHGDVCTAHSDAGSERTLCMLLYTGNSWRPGFGGRFQNIVDGTVARSTEPLGNRLILHRPAPDQIHQVEPIGEAGRLWRRHTYSVWFGHWPQRD